MKASTLIGIVLGTLAIFGSFMLEGGTFDSLWVLPAIVIVLGGTLAATLAGSSFEQFKRIPRLISIAFFPPKFEIQAIINQIVNFSAIARREGILGLERRKEEIKHPFLRKLLEVSIDGADPAALLQTAETDMDFITERHLANISLFTKMGGYSPTMGIIGTVMGLISSLAAAGSEPTVLIHHIATAFIATMWGIFMANIIWLPLGDKLRTLHSEEMQLLHVITSGVHSVQLGETPTVVRAKLMSALPLSQQMRMLKQSLTSSLPKQVVTAAAPAPVNQP
ncbi:MAG: MotA/TolQ/ExbB proton channel family protein [Ignavibacteria bacterium]|nr:MotA/TolQ/ExbB proton channel family protein [Ignavibacteria bacterium]